MTAMAIKWGPTTKEERELIRAIATRAVELASKKAGFDYPFMDASMDITAVHLNDCQLDLARLSEADDANFGHDVFGIRRHIDRSTGKLADCFVPRCAVRSVAD